MAQSAKPNPVAKLAQGCNHDGTLVELHFILSDGAQSLIQFPAHRLADLFLAVQEASVMARSQRQKLAKGADPARMTPVAPMKVTKFRGAVAQGGKPLLMIEINGKLELALDLPRNKIRELIGWLEQLDQAAAKPAHKAN